MFAKFRLIFVLFFFCLQGAFCAEAELVKESQAPNYTINVPMRDGTELPTDLYMPADVTAEKLPCVLIRTPAGRTSHKDAFIPLSQAGYVVAIQDTRSGSDPERKTFPYTSDGWGEQRDGYDSIEWLAKSPWTNGKVATVGFSAMGITQLLTAPTAPPHLCCQYIGMAAASLYHHGMFHGGQALKNLVEGWLQYHKHHPSVLEYITKETTYTDFWKGLDAIPVAHQVRVPGFFYGGWFDIFSQGTLGAFVSRQEYGGEGAKGHQKLIMGPWAHMWPQDMSLGDFQVPDQGKMPPHDISPLRWVDHYLKGKDNGIQNLPPVTYYVMGPFDGSPSKGNVWRTADRWPIPAVTTAFYLTGDGKMEREKAPKEVSQKFFIADPKNPVETIGGRNLFLAAGPKDQRPIEQREDVLVFTTEPLTEDLEVTGRIYAKIFLSSDCDCTDVAVRLTDVYPDGRSILIVDGIYSFPPIKKYHNPSIPREAEIDLWSTSMVFAKGHSIRLSISGSNYPRYEKNDNIVKDGKYLGPPRVAHNQVHIGGAYPSQLLLPLVEEKPIIGKN